MDFLRFCEVTIGPLADWQGGGPKANAVKLRADGTTSNLRVMFSAAKSITGDPNKTELTIFNLSANLRQAIRANLARVQVVAGYDSNPLSAALVSSGALTGVISTRSGGDVATKMTILDGFGGMVRGAVSKSYAGSTRLDQIIRETAAGMPGVIVGKVALPGRVAAKGVQVAGGTTDALNKLADQYGFSWSVQNGVLQAIMDNADTGDAYSFSSRSNLISITPMLDGPTQTENGVEIVAKFEARPKPGDRLNVQSDLNPRLSGTYRATNVMLDFDSHGAATFRAQATTL